MVADGQHIHECQCNIHYKALSDRALAHLRAEKSWVEKFIAEVNQHARTGTH